MKVLLTTPYEIWPANYGGAVRTVAIARALERAGHAVALLSANRSVPGFQSYRGFTTAGYFFNPFFVNELDRVIRGFCPDFIVAAFPYQAAMLIPIASRHRVPLVYDAHNIETLRFARMNKPLQRRIVAFFEKRMLQNSSAVLCVSEAEADYVRTHFKTPIALLPNGVDIQAAKPVTERDYEFCFSGPWIINPILSPWSFSATSGPAYGHCIPAPDCCWWAAIPPTGAMQLMVGSLLAKWQVSPRPFRRQPFCSARSARVAAAA